MTVSSKVPCLRSDAVSIDDEAATEGSGPGDDQGVAIDKGIFIRALTEVRARNPGTAMAQYIESYVTVQVIVLSFYHSSKRSMSSTSVQLHH